MGRAGGGSGRPRGRAGACGVAALTTTPSVLPCAEKKSFHAALSLVGSASEKGVGIVVGVFGAGANQEAAIAGKDGRRWKAAADDKSSPHVPLDVRNLNADINTFSELRFKACPDAADLQKVIGLPAYLQAACSLPLTACVCPPRASVARRRAHACAPPMMNPDVGHAVLWP